MPVYIQLKNLQEKAASRIKLLNFSMSFVTEVFSFLLYENSDRLKILYG